MNLAVAAVGALDAVAGSALELVGGAFAIDGRVGRSVARLAAAAHFVRHVQTIRIAVASPFRWQTGSVAATVLCRRTGAIEQSGAVALVGSAIAIRIAVAHPHLRNAIAIVGTPERTRRAVPIGLFCVK